MKHHIAILGCGGMGKGHAVAIASGNGNPIWAGVHGVPLGKLHESDSDVDKVLTLSGIYDINPDCCDWAIEHGYHVYESYDAILKDPEVDIVLIATPNHLHKEEAIAAMRAGKHVLCEKPATLGSSELEEIMSVAKETGRIFYPRQNRRWDEDYKIVEKIYQKNLLGELFNIECRVLGSRGIPGDWRAKKQFGGGMMLDWGVHIIDRMLVLIPEKVKYVFCSMTHVTNNEVDDGFKMHLTFESGLTSVLEVGTCNFVNLPLWYVAGTDGTAVIYDWTCSGKIIRLNTWEDKDAVPILAGAGLTKTMAPRGDNSTRTLPLPTVSYDNNELYMNLAATIEGTEKQIVTCEQVLRCMKLMEAARKSSDTHSVIAFEA